MRILLINEVFGTTSTGKICAQIAEQYEKEGHTVKVAYGRWGEVPEKYKRFAYRIGSDFDVKMHALETRLFDSHGLGSYLATKRFLKFAKEFNPDLLWIHNIHGYYINYPLLFSWIKLRPNMQIKWTLHDCWAFTGHCVHFTFAKCYKWKNGCSRCCQKTKYPASYLLDGSKRNYKKKKKAFLGVDNMTIITPSNWLADLVHESFLKNYPVKVQYNTVDTKVFKPTMSDFREKYKIGERKMILAVSNTWEVPSKGLSDIYELAKMLDDKYVIVLVGITEELIREIPKNIVGLKKFGKSK